MAADRPGRAPKEVFSAGVRHHDPLADAGRIRSKTESAQRLAAGRHFFRADETRIGDNRHRVSRSVLMPSEIEIILELGPGRLTVVVGRPVLGDEDVVPELRLFRPRPTPVVHPQKRAIDARIRLFGDVDQIVIDPRVATRTADVERRREHALRPRRLGSQTVIHADIVANHGADVADVARQLELAVVAYQQKPAFVVMAIVVLDQGVPAVPVGVEPLRVPRAPCDRSLH
jgi:hypothetical protein